MLPKGCHFHALKNHLGDDIFDLPILGQDSEFSTWARFACIRLYEDSALLKCFLNQLLQLSHRLVEPPGKKINNERIEFFIVSVERKLLSVPNKTSIWIWVIICYSLQLFSYITNCSIWRNSQFLSKSSISAGVKIIYVIMRPSALYLDASQGVHNKGFVVNDTSHSRTIIAACEQVKDESVRFPNYNTSLLQRLQLYRLPEQQIAE